MFKQKKFAKIVERVSTFSLQIFFARNMNHSNCIKSLITKISNAREQVLKTKWLQRTQCFYKRA